MKKHLLSLLPKQFKARPRQDSKLWGKGGTVTRQDSSLNNPRAGHSQNTGCGYLMTNIIVTTDIGASEKWHVN